MFIDRRCTAQAQVYHDMAGQQSSNGSAWIPSPKTPTKALLDRRFKRIMPKPFSAADSNTDYSSDDSKEDRRELSSPASHMVGSSPWSAINSPRSPSPKLQFTNPWSPASTTRSASPHGRPKKLYRAGNIPRSHAPLDLLPPPLKARVTGGNRVNKKHHGSDARSPEALSPKARCIVIDGEYNAGSDDSDFLGHANDILSRKKIPGVFTEEQAAHVLMTIKAPGNSSTRECHVVKRRASA
jgi:hypothetical protein